MDLWQRVLLNPKLTKEHFHLRLWSLNNCEEYFLFLIQPPRCHTDSKQNHLFGNQCSLVTLFTSSTNPLVDNKAINYPRIDTRRITKRLVSI